MINFIRIQAGIDVADSKQVNIQKLCELYGDIKLIEQDLKRKVAPLRKSFRQKQKR